MHSYAVVILEGIDAKWLISLCDRRFIVVLIKEKMAKKGKQTKNA